MEAQGSSIAQSQKAKGFLKGARALKIHVRVAEVKQHNPLKGNSLREMKMTETSTAGKDLLADLTQKRKGSGRKKVEEDAMVFTRRPRLQQIQEIIRALF
jgi:hypothetical protein